MIGPLLAGWAHTGVLRLLRYVVIACVGIPVAYAALYASLVWYLPNRFHRDMGGWSYTDKAVQEIRLLQKQAALPEPAAKAPITDDVLVRQKFGSNVSEVFDATSRRWAGLLLLGTWFALAAAASVAATLSLLLRRSEPTLGLDARISSLVPEIGEDMRRELAQLWHTLREGRYPEGVVITMTRLGLQFMNLLFAASGRLRPSDNLFSCLETAEKEKLMPREMASYMQFIRVLSNPQHHDDERKIRLQIFDAENTLNSFLRVLEWFHCECETNPRRLKSIYTDPRLSAPG